MADKHKLLILISLVAAIVVILAGYFGGIIFKQVKEGGGLPITPSTAPTKAEKVYSASITITKKGFMPATISVKKGTIVTFTNNDSEPHRVATDPHPSHSSVPGFDSQTTIVKGQSYSFYFDKKGSFTYHDETSPIKIKGTIIVE